MGDNGKAPATKQDLVDLESRILEAIRESAQEVETRLLRAFYGYTESTQKHFVDVDQANGSLRDRLGALENRIIEIEKRLNFPPTN